MNEIARALVDSDTALGILPCGSGNGLARHLNLPLRLPRMLERIATFNTVSIDVPMINDEPFFNVSGISFDAKVSHTFSNDPNRGLITYIRSVIQSMDRFKPVKLKVHSPVFRFEGDLFMLSIANSSQFGNNAYINPGTQLDDGMVELCLLRPFPVAHSPMLLWQLFNRQIMQSPYFEVHSVSEAYITSNRPAWFHLDGDPEKKRKHFNLVVKNKALKILT